MDNFEENVGTPIEEKKSGKRIAIILIILLAVIGLGIGIFYLYNAATKKDEPVTEKESKDNYIYKGNIDKVINIDSDEDVTITLDNAKIKTSGPCITSLGKGKLTIKLVGENTLEDGTNYDNEDIDGLIFVKGDLSITGDGKISIKASYDDGIVSKGNISITGGDITINAKDDCIKGKDSVYIEDGIFSLTSDEGTGIKSSNEEDSTKGYIVIKNGTFNIKSGNNGIKSITKLTIDGGTFNIDSVEALESTYLVINDGDITITASDDGINASVKSTYMTPTIEINGGKIKITMAEGDTDAFDSNGNLYINDGEINITARSAFDYDNEGKLNGGTVIVNGEQVYELAQMMMGEPGMPR